jgi:deazaflavin-dependent oxidoreductase (nitroreductase family)
MELSAPNWYTRLVRYLGHHRWFAVAMRNVGWRLDKLLLRVSHGRVDLSGPDIPTLLLTTTGRRTGEHRTVPLAYVRDGPNLVVACENFGLNRQSAWPLNALAAGNVLIDVNGQRQEHHTRRATTDELVRVVPALTTMWPAHDTYFDRTGHRDVIVFEPIPS